MKPAMIRDTGAWQLQVWASFAIAVFLCAVGLAYLPGAEWEAQMPAQEARYRRIWEATPWN